METQRATPGGNAQKNPTGPGPLKEWYKTASVPVGGKHGTAVLMAAPQGKSCKKPMLPQHFPNHSFSSGNYIYIKYVEEFQFAV
jgi:hypothetical protein